MTSQEITILKKPKLTITSQKDIDIIDNEIGILEFQLTDFPPDTLEDIQKIKDDIDKKIVRKQELQAKIDNRTTRGFNMTSKSKGKHRKRTQKRKHKKRKTKKRKPKNKRKTKKR